MTLSDYNSDASSTTSNDSTESVSLEQDDLLQIIQILMLPAGSLFDLDITRWKDVLVVEMITDLHSKTEIEGCYFASAAAKIITFINTNRVDLRKRRVNLKYFEDEELKNMIKNAL